MLNIRNAEKLIEAKGIDSNTGSENMGRYKVIMTHREGKHEMIFFIDFSTKEEFHKEMIRIFDEWIKKTGVSNFTNTSITYT